jgi:hypothetical protein
MGIQMSDSGEVSDKASDKAPGQVKGKGVCEISQAAPVEQLIRR